MTVYERLEALGAGKEAICRAAQLLVTFVPLDRAVTITDEMVEAAHTGDATLLAALLAEEVDPDADDLAALKVRT